MRRAQRIFSFGSVSGSSKDSNSNACARLYWRGSKAMPEQLFVASLSACHMLWFVSLAAGRKLIVNRYVDDAEGVAREEFRRPHGGDARHPAARGRIRAPPSPAALAELQPQSPREMLHRKFGAHPGDRPSRVSGSCESFLLRGETMTHETIEIQGRAGRCGPLAQPARRAQRLNDTMIAELTAAFGELERDPAVRAVCSRAAARCSAPAPI